MPGRFAVARSPCRKIQLTCYAATSRCPELSMVLALGCSIQGFSRCPGLSMALASGYSTQVFLLFLSRWRVSCVSQTPWPASHCWPLATVPRMCLASLPLSAHSRYVLVEERGSLSVERRQLTFNMAGGVTQASLSEWLGGQAA